MNRNDKRLLRHTLRPLGALMLAGDYKLSLHLVAMSHGGQGWPVYPLAAAAFALLTAGAALLMEGPHLFDRVPVSQRWISHAPPAIEQSRWSAEPEDETRPIAA